MSQTTVIVIDFGHDRSVASVEEVGDMVED